MASRSALKMTSIPSMTFHNSSLEKEEEMNYDFYEQIKSLVESDDSSDDFTEDDEDVEESFLDISAEEPVLGKFPIDTKGTITVVLPSLEYICVICKQHMGKASELVAHFNIKHRDIPLVFKCAKCDKTNSNHRSIACHAPKCGGIKLTEESLPMVCECCQARFATLSGLSQHKRHAHPVTRNEERIKDGIKGTSQRGVHRSCWSLKEVEHKKTGAPMSDSLHFSSRPLETLSPPPNVTTGTSSILAQAAERLTNENSGTLEKPAMEAIKAWLNGEGQHDALVETATALMLCPMRLVKNKGKRSKPENDIIKPRILPTRSWMKKRAEKRGSFMKHQKLFFKNRSLLASLVLDGTERHECRIPNADVYRFYCEKWEKVLPFNGLGQFKSSGVANNEYFEPLISVEEVQTAIRAIKPTSAAGPDGLTRAAICAADPEGRTLTALFNAWMITGIIPKELKKNRTILIPKVMDDEKLKELGNWRPITIGSMILRLFSRIMTARLARACPLNPRQRGFIAASGCSENLKVLQDLMRHAKKLHRPLAVMFIDIAKAFDSVSHAHILWVLRHKKVDEHVVGIIQNAYDRCTTSFKSNGESTREISIRVGVKQGDPMSPLLFNLAMDPLICTLESHGVGYSIDTDHVTALAFADDLVLVSESWVGMAANLAILESFCGLSGLEVQARKCQGFMISPTKDSYTVNNCDPWTIKNKDVHMIQPDESTKYLGLKIGPWTGTIQPDLHCQLKTWISKIDEAPLKPTQKVELLNAYALPRLLYPADHSDCKQSTLRGLDQEIRKAVKGWLHLPASTCDGLLYARARDGGLAILKLEKTIPSVQVRRLQRIANSSDAITRNIVSSQGMEEEYRNLWVRAGGDSDAIPTFVLRDSVSKEPVYPRPCDWREHEFQRWCEKPVQGRGIVNFAHDRISNAWLRPWCGFKQCFFIAALQLRANIYPTRESLNRGRDGALRSCRKCSARLESLSHILGQCPAVQKARIARHNKISNILADEAARLGWSVYKEPRFISETGEMRKPDLVFAKDEEAVVIDVTVRFELSKNTLSDAASHKVSYYTPLGDQVKVLTKASKVTFFGFPVGARGKWPLENNEVLTSLGLTKPRTTSLAKMISRRTLLFSLDILRMFCGNYAVYEQS
uniref:Reverse transcriptase domain-containing protein n=1 Tax=Xiphophorus couchianus TaxID=32473 RepID=A0A3B5M253_9TELE